MVIFLPFFALKNVPKYIFYSVFEHQPNFAPKRAPKQNDNFSHFAKHRLIKKKLLLQPPSLLTKQLCVCVFYFILLFWTKNIHVEQKT